MIFSWTKLGIWIQEIKTVEGIHKRKDRIHIGNFRCGLCLNKSLIYFLIITRNGESIKEYMDKEELLIKMKRMSDIPNSWTRINGEIALYLQ